MTPNIYPNQIVAADIYPKQIVGSGHFPKQNSWLQESIQSKELAPVIRMHLYATVVTVYFWATLTYIVAEHSTRMNVITTLELKKSLRKWDSDDSTASISDP